MAVVGLHLMFFPSFRFDSECKVQQGNVPCADDEMLDDWDVVS